MLSLLLQISLLAHPLYLEEEPPELRAVQHILLLYGDDELARHERTAEETQALADHLVLRLRGGEPLAALALQYSDDPNVRRNEGTLGSYAPGMLAPTLDAFLFAADFGDTSEPLLVGGGIEILQRVETHAGVLQILVSGDDGEAKIEKVRERLAAGEEFTTLARELSDDPVSRARGGQLAVFERGPSDKLLKAAAFSAEVGDVVGPVRSSHGLHLLKRVPPEEIDPALVENNWVRMRALVVQHDMAEGADPETAPTMMEARHIVDQIEQRLAAGEDLARVAADQNDDPGGRERHGDLGWIHRKSPRLQRVLGHGLRARIGELSGPHQTPHGWVFLRREL
jgi:parvulin-like peptidyl-prolyl isomerase